MRRDRSRILVGAQWSCDPRGGPWAQNLLKIGLFSLKITWKLHDSEQILGTRGPQPPLDPLVSASVMKSFFFLFQESAWWLWCSWQRFHCVSQYWTWQFTTDPGTNPFLPEYRYACINSVPPRAGIYEPNNLTMQEKAFGLGFLVKFHSKGRLWSVGAHKARYSWRFTGIFFFWLHIVSDKSTRTWTCSNLWDVLANILASPVGIHAFGVALILYAANGGQLQRIYKCLILLVPKVIHSALICRHCWVLWSLANFVTKITPVFRVFQYIVLDVIGRLLRMGTEYKPKQVTPRPCQVGVRKPSVPNGNVAKQEVRLFCRQGVATSVYYAVLLVALQVHFANARQNKHKKNGKDTLFSLLMVTPWKWIKAFPTSLLFQPEANEISNFLETNFQNAHYSDPQAGSCQSLDDSGPGPHRTLGPAPRKRCSNTHWEHYLHTGSSLCPFQANSGAVNVGISNKPAVVPDKPKRDWNMVARVIDRYVF